MPRKPSPENRLAQPLDQQPKVPNIALRLPYGIKDEIVAIAKHHDRSVAAQCFRLIRLGLDMEKQQQGGM